jgi:hypothetical protein
MSATKEQGVNDAGIVEGRTGTEGRSTMPARYLPSCQAKRSDTLIASMLLVLLIAGWILNFVSIKQVSLRLDSLVAATSRWA